jgi:hypothetical protein
MDATSRNDKSTARAGRAVGHDAGYACVNRGRIPDEEAEDFYIKPNHQRQITRNGTTQNGTIWDSRSEYE